MRRRIASALLAFFFALLLVSCGQASSESSSSPRASQTTGSDIIDSGIPATIDLQTEAKAESSTPGRTALALLICRLDKTSSLKSLAQKSASDLFAMLRETAVQHAQTLQALNERFGLTDILASEGIYVKISGNMAQTVSLPIQPNAGWETQFENAYNAASSSTSS